MGEIKFGYGIEKGIVWKIFWEFVAPFGAYITQINEKQLANDSGYEHVVVAALGEKARKEVGVRKVIQCKRQEAPIQTFERSKARSASKSGESVWEVRTRGAYALAEHFEPVEVGASSGKPGKGPTQPFPGISEIFKDVETG
jgi:hypothetical protein